MDGGESWTSFNEGLTNRDVTTLVVDPITGLNLHVGTDGGGVFDYEIVPAEEPSETVLKDYNSSIRELFKSLGDSVEKTL